MYRVRSTVNNGTTVTAQRNCYNQEHGSSGESYMMQQKRPQQQNIFQIEHYMRTAPAQLHT